jgi:hypothetical protein
MTSDVLLRKLIDQYELVTHNQAVTHERLTMLLWLMGFGIFVGLVVLGVQIAILVVKIGTRREMADIREMLAIVKGWAYNARANVNDANATLQTVKNAAEAAVTHPTREEKQMARAVEQIPERTADKVVEKLGGSDVIKRLLFPPLLATLAVAGTAVAAPRADAADDLRAKNAAAATAWAKGG